MTVMFPGANSVVYYNEDGEPLGWDTFHTEYPEEREEDWYGGNMEDAEPPEPDSLEECISWNCHAQDGDGVGKTDEGSDIWECLSCGNWYYYYDNGIEPERRIDLSPSQKEQVQLKRRQQAAFEAEAATTTTTTTTDLA